ncbi:Tctex-1 [Lipomyces arxii]|uniref:Tctex-1 n=1 Tax=Lipomyces arxii TaxID=56418 RepID=UPI0034CE35EF
MSAPILTEDSLKLAGNTPISIDRLGEICKKACEDAIPQDYIYEHAKVAAMTQSIVQSSLKQLVDACQTHKFIVYVTVIQRGPGATRGIHTGSGAFWNSEKDGMFNYSFSGGDSEHGVDTVVSVSWIARE